MSKGQLIVLEGLDGSGKSLQAELLGNRMRGEGMEFYHGTSPSRGPVGCLIRERDPEVDWQILLPLFIADFHDHIRTAIQPALNAGKHVICERWILSTMAYQGGEGYAPFEMIAGLGRWVLRPLVTVFVDVPLVVRMERMGDRRLDTYELEEHQRRVEKNYSFILDRWLDNELGIDQNILVVDGQGSKEEVAKRVWSVIPGFG